MARLPRIYIEGCSYHIVQRGNNREPCFYLEQDYVTYLAYLKDSAEVYGVEIHAYVLMTNHVHMLVTPMVNGDISRMMQSLGRKYVVISILVICERALYGKEGLNPVWLILFGIC